MFFPGVGGALILLDALIVRTDRLATGNGTVPTEEFRILVLPVIHLLAFCYAAYAPVIDGWIQARFRYQRKSLRGIMVAICCIAYSSAAYISL